ncbi:MAG TPA: exodeoxyribonuclease VII small subunit [Acidimicrobiales bacterium]|nr:exodeoxyribonuclease VII small subunit [Acidimicrobiales bacterium]
MSPGDASAPAAGAGPPGDGRTFEELMAELEQITAQLAAGELGIEAAADLYERAERLHALATERLERVKQRVEGLTGPGGDGD